MQGENALWLLVTSRVKTAVRPRCSRPSKLGGIDILVNNAAFQRTYAELTDMSTEEWDTTMRTNIYARFFLSRAAAPHMKGRLEEASSRL
jgi:NAD(P)-dependent dehydrogenase (short-subunit alcohol dehydrogenase family)